MSALHPYGVTRVQPPGLPPRPQVACLIIGIDGWEQYTLPLIQSIRRNEPTASIVVVDNASQTPYPTDVDAIVTRTARVSYATAINHAAGIARLITQVGWYVVLSNDVLCLGPFADQLPRQTDSIVGPCLKATNAAGQSWPYLEGWCVAAPKAAWDTLGGWDEGFVGSSWEDVAFSTAALQRGMGLVHLPRLPFVHLDQRQRFHVIPDYWSTEAANIRHFVATYAGQQP